MSRTRRLRRLRELLERIERLPASPESERMVRELRARIVDVETGVTPRGMLPVDPDLTLVSEPAASPPPARKKPVPVAPAKVVPQPAAGVPAAALPVPEETDWLSRARTDEVLSLADSSPLLPAGEPRAGLDRRPWTRGLRG